MRVVLTAPFAAAVLFLVSYVHPALAAGKARPLFASDEVLSLSLSGPIGGLSRKGDAKPVPGVLKVQGASAESLPVALSTRGITRRRVDICSFPPIRLEFTQKPDKASIFRGQKQLKLVTHCQPEDSYQQGLLLEYSAYRLFNAMTPESFRARLAKIDYADEKGRPIATRYGFLLEDIDDVAGRNGQKRFKTFSRISPDQLDPDAAARFAVFEYMISNLDWAMTANAAGMDCCHNSRLLGAKGSAAGLIPVPYDFDYSGLVDAPYAVPPEGIRVDDVRQRLYRGYCQHNAQAQAFAAGLYARRAALLDIVDRTPQLNQASRKKAAAYLGQFFDRISSPENIAKILAACIR